MVYFFCMNEKTYLGWRDLTGRLIVCVKIGDEKPYKLSITRSLKIWNHSPTGFECGYGGSGPAQLALAILLDVTGDEDVSNYWHQAFKGDIIARLPNDKEWEIKESEVFAWLRVIQKRQGEKQTI